MTGLLLAGLGMQFLVWRFSRSASSVVGMLAALVLLLISAGRLGIPDGAAFFGAAFPAWIAVLLALVWLVGSLLALMRGDDPGITGFIAPVLNGLFQGTALCVMVVVAMAVLVFPFVLLATSIPVVFRLFALACLAVLSVMLLLRKYRTMKALDQGDTRAVNGSGARPPLLRRFLYRVVVRPLLIVAVVLAYAYGARLLSIAPVWGALLLAVLSVAVMLLSRILRRTAYVSARE